MSENPAAEVAPMLMRELIAEEIRALLGRRKLSASELARRIGVTQPYISRRLTGDVALNVDELEQIAVALGVEMADLMPRREGKVIAVGGTSGNPRRESKPWNFRMTKRTGPNGPPSRSGPTVSTERTGRIHTAQAA